MRFDNRWSWCAWGLLIAAACLTMGQSCGGPAPSNVPVASACGLNAAYCVEVVGKSPFTLAGGDFNSDGRPDVAVSNFGTDNIEILLNDGRGVLVPAGRYKTGDSPNAVVAADFNADGSLDLAASDGVGVAVLIGHGDGTFDPVVHAILDQKINASPLSVTAADFNGDGAIDLAAYAMGWTYDFADVTSTDVDNVAILLNDGTGHFSLVNTIRFNNPSLLLGDIAAGDVDGDGRPDLAVALSTGQITVLLNQGEGQFGNAFYLPFGENHVPGHVRLADLNGDGRLDLVLADNGDLLLDPANAGGDVAVFFNQGGGTFAPAIRLRAGVAPSYVAIGDVNGDTRPDLVVVNNLSDDVTVLVNRGGGQFEPPWTFASGDGPTSAVLADFNGNGIVDLAVSFMNAGSVGVYLNDGTGDFTSGR